MLHDPYGCHLARQCNSKIILAEELAEEGNLTDGEILKKETVDTSK